MIKYIKNKDLENEDFLKGADFFFLSLEKARWPRNTNNIAIQRQVQYPYCYKLLKLKGTERVLDAGCGHTVWPYFLKELYPNTEIHLFDSYEPKLNVYPEKIGIKKVGNLTNIKYPDNYFDVVYCISTLEHEKNWEKVIKEFSRILKINGHLLMVVDGMIGDKYFKEEDVEKLVKMLKKEFVIDTLDLSTEDNWIYSGIEGTTMSLMISIKKI
jgi:ubiquinone/menaquinone biosynthesis C-methylase UbiE